MSLVETEALILRSYNLAEADKIVVCLTRDAGVVRAVAKGARRLKSRFGAGLEPFTLISMSYYEKEGRELVSLRQAEIERSHFNLAARAGTVAALSYMSELVLEFAPPHEPNEKLFRMLKACFDAFAAAPEQAAALTLYCEIWTLKISGFWPDWRACAECGQAFAATATAYLNAEFRPRCEACGGARGTALPRGARAAVRSALRRPPAEFAVEFAGAVPAGLADVTREMIRRVLERAPRAAKHLAAGSAPESDDAGREAGATLAAAVEG